MWQYCQRFLSTVDVSKWLQQASTTTAADFGIGERKQSSPAMAHRDLLGDESSELLHPPVLLSQTSFADSLDFCLFSNCH